MAQAHFIRLATELYAPNKFANRKLSLEYCSCCRTGEQNGSFACSRVHNELKQNCKIESVLSFKVCSHAQVLLELMTPAASFTGVFMQLPRVFVNGRARTDIA